MGTQNKNLDKPRHRGLKHYILYCLENDNFKRAQISSVSTECILLVCFIKYVVTITIKNEFTYTGNQIDS